MKRFLSIVLFQLNDKVDFSWRNSTKTIIQKIVFTILKFVGIAFSIYIVFNLLNLLAIFTIRDVVVLFTVFFLVFSILELLSITLGLTKSLYFSDDNKVLITLPVKSGQLFFSKIVVYYLFQLIKSTELLIPVCFGFILTAVFGGQIEFVAIPWMFLVILVVVALYVIVAAILSIPALYIYMFLKRLPVLELIFAVILASAIVTGLVFLINMIPININLINEWPNLKRSFINLLEETSVKAGPFYVIARTLTGEVATIGYKFKANTFIKFGLIFATTVVCGLIAYFVIKPLYFKMATKAFEFDKAIIDDQKENKVRKPILTFVNKELKICFRDVEISASYISVYILVPLLLLLLDRLFSAITRSLTGDIMCFAFNILLICLPLLASNSIIATLYSKEGRTAYMKKTKPVDELIPLSSKLVFNLILSIPSIAVSSFIFGRFANIGIFIPIILGFSVLLLQYGHIFFSATLDIMNPQNEVYATDGEEINNPNERKATIVGFLLSFFVAFVSFVFMKEGHISDGSYLGAFIKLFGVCLFVFASFFILYVLKVKAYYNHRDL